MADHPVANEAAQTAHELTAALRRGSGLTRQEIVDEMQELTGFSAVTCHHRINRIERGGLDYFLGISEARGMHRAGYRTTFEVERDILKAYLTAIEATPVERSEIIAYVEKSRMTYVPPSMIPPAM